MKLRTFRAALFLAMILMVVWSEAGHGFTDYSNLPRKRMFVFEFDRGRETHIFRDSSLVYFALPTRTKYGTSSNADIWAYDLRYWSADTASHHYKAQCILPTKGIWAAIDVPSSIYRFYEVGGSGPDSLIAGLDSVSIGAQPPDKSIVLASIPDNLIDGTKISTGATVQVYEVKTNRLNPASGNVISIPTSGVTLKADTIRGYSGSQISFADGKILVGNNHLEGIVQFADGEGHWLSLKLNRGLATNQSWTLPTEITASMTGTLRAIYIPGLYDAPTNLWSIAYANGDTPARFWTTYGTDTLYVHASVSVSSMPVTILVGSN